MVAKTGDVNSFQYKGSFRFRHDIEAFKEQKPADLEGNCPFLDIEGPCSYGLACRYLGMHKEDVSGGSLNGGKKGFEVNGLSKDVQKLLWKNNMKFPKADANLKALGLLGSWCCHNDTIMGHITLYTLWQMVEMHEMVPGKRFDRYHELGQHAFGKKLGLWIVVPQQLMVEVGVNVVYMVIGGKSLKKFHDTVCPSCKPLKTTYFIMIFGSVHFVLSHLPNFNSITGVSFAAAIMSFRG